MAGAAVAEEATTNASAECIPLSQLGAKADALKNTGVKTPQTVQDLKQEKDADLKALRDENTVLKERLAALEKRLAKIEKAWADDQKQKRGAMPLAVELSK
jgi:hypothetical protein